MQYVLLLILLQVLWSSTYVVMKVASGAMPIGLVLVFRYGFAALALVWIAFRRGVRWRRRDFILALVIGLLDFSISPYLQLTSLTLTRASDVAVIVALEPLVAALLAAIVLRERLGWSMLITFAVATSGVLIMSGVQWDGGSVFGAMRLFGNALFFGAVICEAVYSVASRQLTRRYDPLRLSAIMIVAGALANIATNWPLLAPTHLRAISWHGWLAVLYLGLACSAFGYTAWVWLVKRIPVSQISLSLFLQPILGGVFGYLFLQEQPTWRSMTGAGITVASLVVWLYCRRPPPVKMKITPDILSCEGA